MRFGATRSVNREVRLAPVAATGGAALAEGVRQGEAQAFRALFDGYYRKLFAFAWRVMHDEVGAEEVVQDVLLAVWEQRATWAPASIEAYLYAAVRNRALSALKRQRVAHRYAEQLGAIQADPRVRPAAYAADVAHDAAELDAAIRRTIAALPERCQQMFLLNREGELSYSEIATVLGVSVKTVETQIGRALTVLRRELRDWLIS